MKTWIFIVILAFSVSVVGAEGYSSSEPAGPANIYYRAFTIDTLQEACDASPPVATIKLWVPSTRINVGDRIRTNYPDDSVVSDLIIEAFDRAGTFLPAVPVWVSAGSLGRTATFDPGIIYRDASMEYWEAKKPGQFAITATWPCAVSTDSAITDTVIVDVLAPGE